MIVNLIYFIELIRLNKQINLINNQGVNQVGSNFVGSGLEMVILPPRGPIHMSLHPAIVVDWVGFGEKMDYIGLVISFSQFLFVIWFW